MYFYLTLLTTLLRNTRKWGNEISRRTTQIANLVATELIVNYNIDIEGFKFRENGFKIPCSSSFSEHVNETVWSKRVTAVTWKSTRITDWMIVLCCFLIWKALLPGRCPFYKTSGLSLHFILTHGIRLCFTSPLWKTNHQGN